MTVGKLTTTIAAMPRHLRHVIASIVAYQLSPTEPRRIDDEYRRKTAPWQEIWRMARDHGPRYRWPTSEEVAGGLAACGVAKRTIDKLVAIYDDYGDVKTANVNVYHMGYNRPEGTKALPTKKVSRDYEWSGHA